ncbi:MAG: hypothetical protein JSU70_14460 [Phycisphaerales bacterium]|nr:MAG: hypothetical protein JSU70_14460 [Phycisphaerales bacterium]
MNLVKWFRKNNKKVMAVVVVVIMIGFIGGSALPYLFRGTGGLHKAVAYFADGEKITPNKRNIARRELDLLRMLRAGDLLRSQDLRGMALSELLFSEGRGSPMLINRIKQMIRENQLRVSDAQINDLYQRQMPSDICWLLLNHEVEQAGVRVANEEVGKLLSRVIPQMFNGQSYSQLIGSIVNRQGVPQEQILATYGKLLAVWQYALMVSSNQDVTNSQIRHMASWENETVNAELVRLDAAVFARILPETEAEPSEDQISAHFDKYKQFFAGEVSEQNPYGFGYKLADRVRLEYMAIKLSDVSPTVSPPTAEECEQYYERNRERLFTQQVPADPLDPNSERVPQTRSYAEVASVVREQLLRNKINSKADQILIEAKNRTEPALETLDAEAGKPTTEQIKKLAGDYAATSVQLGEEYKIKIYTGQTGMLSSVEMQTDKHLGRLIVMSQQFNPVRLSQIVFSVDELTEDEPVSFDTQKPRMYENIGPAKDMMAEMGRDLSGLVVAILRVVDVAKASEPESLDQTFSTRTLELGQEDEDKSDTTYSVREKVTKDIKNLAALDATRGKAEELIALAAQDGWENALGQFNKLYGEQAKQDPNDDPNAFKMENLTGLRRISRGQLATLQAHSAGDPSQAVLTREAKAEQQFIEQLYSLVPLDSNSVENLPLIMEFKPNMSLYCLKHLSVERLGQEQYEKLKAVRLYREDQVQSQSLALVHFNPENIVKRMNLRSASESEKPADANATTQAKEAS